MYGGSNRRTYGSTSNNGGGGYGSTNTRGVNDQLARDRDYKQRLAQYTENTNGRIGNTSNTG